MSEGIVVIDVREGFSSLAKEVKKCLKGGKVLLFAREDREGEDAAAALSVEGFTVLKRTVKDAFIMRHTFDREDTELVRAVIGVGGLTETEAAKDLSVYAKLPTFLYPTDLSALSAENAEAEFTTSVRRVTVRADAFTLVADDSLYATLRGVRSGLGYLLSRLTGVMDGAYAELVLHGRDPAASLTAIRKTFAFWNETSDDPLPKRVVSTAFFLGTAVRESGLPIVKSATELAFLSARKSGGRYDAYLFPAAYALLELYRYYLSDFPLECALPPDRAENVARIEAACGLASDGYLTNCKFYADGYAERMHVTGEYREDFLQTVSALPLAELCRVYRRAEGASEGQVLSSESLLDLLSLTGEAVSGYALVRHIKLTGLLEPLLSSA